MDKLLPSKKLRKEFAELTRVDINSIVCLFLLSLLFAYVFLEMVYDRFIKDTTLQISIIDYLTAFKKRQHFQFVNQ